MTFFTIQTFFQWNGKQVEDLYLIVLTQDRNIRSIRELTGEHLPLLKNIWNKGCKGIMGEEFIFGNFYSRKQIKSVFLPAKYGVPSSKLRVYFHYQPSFYHLHVHFSHVAYHAPGTQTEKAHLLATVIHNLERDPGYYRRGALTFSVKESDNLYKAYMQAGYNFEGGKIKFLIFNE